jgi:hypothetical protein
MQTVSSETLIGWKSGKISLYGNKWRERGYGLRAHSHISITLMEIFADFLLFSYYRFCYLYKVQYNVQ